MADGPRASVILPTHQRREALSRALRALTRQAAPAGSFEAIVSVDGSTDGTLEMLDEIEVPYPLRSVRSPERGRAAARNAALAVARGEVVILLDDDMQATPALIESHLAHHPPASRLCVLGPVPIDLDGSSPHAARYVQAKFAAHLAELAKPDHRYVARDFYSGNTSIRADILREVGGFDTSFTPYGNEDVELSLRLRDAGVTFRYEPRAIARQEYAKDLRGLARDTVAKGGTAVMLAQLHPGEFKALRLAAPRDGSRPWLAARALLLRLTRRWRGLAAVVFGVAALFERLGLWRQPLFYRAVLDYAFWAGVDAEIRKPDRTADLSRLAAELHRGPIDLLLHG